MILTALRLARFALSQLRGSPINTQNLHQLIADARRTLWEFGSPGEGSGDLLGTAFAEAEQQEFQRDSFHRTLRWLGAASPYYRDLLATLPQRLTRLHLEDIPLTRRSDLGDPRRFLTSQALFSTRTTGTTGSPAVVYLSAYEYELWSGFMALGVLLRNEYAPADCFQINLRLRATAAVQLVVEGCRLLGATTHVLGILPPDESLDSLLLAQPAPTHLHTYPSYLGKLVQAARRRGLSPHDFHLREIQTVGEVLGPELAVATRQIFGSSVTDTYNSTESLPIAGVLCDQQKHLHFNPQLGLVEVLDPATNREAEPGQLGTLVITPFYPYRTCMPLLRYCTNDLAYALPDGEMTCNLARLPATSLVWGKREQALLTQGIVCTPRQIVMAIESLPSPSFPTRYGARAGQHGIELTISSQASQGLTERELRSHLQAAGLPISHLSILPEEKMLQVQPLRADMVETPLSAGRKDAVCSSKVFF